ncbi:hypothetical protein PHBOTO_003525 [Pseudozyma hubeiensis]|nr:hypothetical protein PHBOTO_003525 [Pseudozyma hubeiensis]
MLTFNIRPSSLQATTTIFADTTCPKESNLVPRKHLLLQRHKHTRHAATRTSHAGESHRAVQRGRDYPDPKYNFLGKLRSMFARNAHLTDEKEIQAKLDLAEFVKRETETLYSLKKYRTMRRRYVQD